MARPFKFQDLAELQALVDSYFANCDNKKEPYTVTGLALWLKCDKDTILNYKKREDEMADYSALIKEAYMKVENFAEKRLYASSGVVAGPIFALKNFGWKDQRQTDLTTAGEKLPTPILGNILNPNEIPDNNGNKETSEAK